MNVGLPRPVVNVMDDTDQLELVFVVSELPQIQKLFVPMKQATQIIVRGRKKDRDE